ncbi:unnamed protein product [Orchesella dallaii]|uniref:Uncharacterized protein n=1 Tax=Orchesella dallaii TaxID=48710 RepID=A0ABP1QUY7_9HEXA
MELKNRLTPYIILALFPICIFTQLPLQLILPYFLIVLAITLVAEEGRINYGVLEQSGIPVVEPTLFLGSEPDYHRRVQHLVDIERFKKYGPIWGSYVGRAPHIFITDPELIRLIFVKDSSSHFENRQDYEFGCALMNEVMEFKKGEEWRVLRDFLSPLFTTSKINHMSQVIGSCAKEFASDLKSECDKNGRVKVDCRIRLTTSLIDMFAQTTLGVRMEDRKDPRNLFAQALRMMMHGEEEMNFIYTLSLSFPILQKLTPIYGEGIALLDSTFRNVIKKRIAGGCCSSTAHNDFLDFICCLWKRVEKGEFQELGFTQTTVLSQCVLFFLGGYDTMASTLCHLLWNMATHPEEQEEMYEELKRALANHPKGEEIDHELIHDSNIPFISACIYETLRLQPSLYRPERICGNDWNHEGLSIKKGTVVIIPTWAANRNPKFYPDEPEKFKPERLIPENNEYIDPYAFTSFGFGPRNCIGKRFACESMKLFACHIVRNFRVELREDSVLEYKPGSPIVVAFNPLYLDFVKRNKKVSFFTER